MVCKNRDREMQASVNTTSTIHVPDEVLFYILLFLTPREVVRLRLVSRQFNGVTRDARLWRMLYTNSRLLRPSGPFLWQSAQFLERILMQSARVSQTWTSQPMSVASCLRGPRIPLQSSPVSTSFDFLFGRLFIWCEGEHLLAQDLETGVGRLLWESTQPISSLSACSLPFPDSERVFIALRHVDVPVAKRTPMHVPFPSSHPSLILIIPIPSKLLEFPLQDDIRLMLGPVTFDIDLPGYANFPLSASAPFLYFDGGTERMFAHTYERVVIDTRTWAIYRFPVFSSSIGEAIHWEPIPQWSEFTLLSGRHIVVFHPWQRSNPPKTLIQVFDAPDASHTDAGQLRLTHETLVPFAYTPICCLRSAVVDPLSGEVNVRFLGSRTQHPGRTSFLCINLTIPPEDPDFVLPMLAIKQELFVLSGEQRTVFADASNDGHGRGIITLSPSESPESWDGHFPVSLYKFAIDASGESCTALISEPSELASQDVTRYLEYHIFDGVRGRICHDVKAKYGCSDLMVLDLH